MNLPRGFSYKLNSRRLPGHTTYEVLNSEHEVVLYVNEELYSNVNATLEFENSNGFENVLLMGDENGEKQTISIKNSRLNNKSIVPVKAKDFIVENSKNITLDREFTGKVEASEIKITDSKNCSIKFHNQQEEKFAVKIENNENLNIYVQRLRGKIVEISLKNVVQIGEGRPLKIQSEVATLNNVTFNTTPSSVKDTAKEYYTTLQAGTIYLSNIDAKVFSDQRTTIIGAQTISLSGNYEERMRLDLTDEEGKGNMCVFDKLSIRGAKDVALYRIDGKAGEFWDIESHEVSLKRLTMCDFGTRMVMRGDVHMDEVDIYSGSNATLDLGNIFASHSSLGLQSMDNELDTVVINNKTVHNATFINTTAYDLTLLVKSNPESKEVLSIINKNSDELIIKGLKLSENASLAVVNESDGQFKSLENIEVKGKTEIKYEGNAESTPLSVINCTLEEAKLNIVSDGERETSIANSHIKGEVNIKNSRVNNSNLIDVTLNNVENCEESFLARCVFEDVSEVYRADRQGETKSNMKVIEGRSNLAEVKTTNKSIKYEELEL
jgi:hypothetical protein